MSINKIIRLSLSTKVVTCGQSPPNLIVSTLKYILQRLLQVHGQLIYCTCRRGDAMQLFCVLEVGTLFLQILRT